MVYYLGKISEKEAAALSWLTDSLREFKARGDKLLLALCLILSLFGVALVYSATRYTKSSRSAVVQLIGIVLGVILYILLSSVDFELFTQRTWKWLFPFSVLFILTTLTPWGVEYNGNRSWLQIPHFPTTIQPAEISKVFFILLLALQFSRLRERGISRPASVFSTAGHTLFMCGVIAVASGDFGMALIYGLIFVVMAWAAGVKLRWFVLAAVVIAVAAAILWPHLASDVHFRRISIVIDHLTGNEATLYDQTMDTGWQQTRSIMAIGSGGLWGQGYLKGIQTQSPYRTSLPARMDDEIFAVCGEELGLVGCLVLLLLLAAIIVRCLWVARQASSYQSALVATGMAGMLAAQVCINVGMCLYLFPVVGITLPFVSAGGTSLITMFAAMGAVSSIKTRSLPSWLRDRSQL